MSSDDGNIHYCGELFLPAELAQDAVENALRENPDNAGNSPDLSVPSAGGIVEPSSGAPEPSDAPLPPASSAPPGDFEDFEPPEITEEGGGGPIEPPVAIGLYVRKMWKNGRTLRVLFLSGGSNYVRSKVKQYAAVWTKYANIHFQFVDSGPAEIRITFKLGDGSWSYIGTDALSIPAAKPTMNYGWFNDNTSDEEFSRTITHEFGHAIGCIHEQSQPNANIQWNKPVVYAAYWNSQRWTPAQVDAQVFARYSSADVRSTAFDAVSIMEYPIPANFTLNGFSAPNNTHLSQTDIAFISRMYPYPNTGGGGGGTGTARSGVETGVFNTMSIRPWSSPALQNRTTIKFAGAPLKFPPQFIMGLNWLDYGNRGNIRIKSLVEGVTNQGASINLQSWADTVNYSTGVAWLQLPTEDRDFQHGAFNTMDDHDWTRPQPQTKRKIYFKRAYPSPPKIAVFLTSLDVEHTANCRVKTYVTEVATDSFTIHIDSWAETKLWSTGVAWLAFPSNKKGITTGTFSTNDIRKWNQPRATNSSRVSLTGGSFTRPPKIFLALNMLDIDKNANARVRLSASSVTPSSMEWHIDTWGDTTLYAAGATYIALDPSASGAN